MAQHPAHRTHHRPKPPAPKPPRPPKPPRHPRPPHNGSAPGLVKDGEGRPVYTYAPERSERLFLGLESFARHMTDEGFQLQEGLRLQGYSLWGKGYPAPYAVTDVGKILRDRTPGVVIVQDKREWDPSRSGCFDKSAAFHRVGRLALQKDVFRVTICKDAQQDPDYHGHFANEIGAHAWIVYYHPNAICPLAPYLRRPHLIRTYHSVDPAKVPAFRAEGRRPCLLSGSLSRAAYPLRYRLAQHASVIPGMDVQKHPGYHAEGCETDDYLSLLSCYRVSIATASKYGYALRKIIESTACGCRVITDLPAFDVLPEIDDNLVRISPDMHLLEMADLIRRVEAEYDAERQEFFAKKAVEYYDFRRRGEAIAQAIERLRKTYPEVPSDG